MKAKYTNIAILVVALIIAVTLIYMNHGRNHDLTDEQVNTIMSQYNDDDEFYADKYLESKWFVNAEVFDVEKSKNAMTVYTMVYDCQYAKFKDRAYLLSGSMIPTKFTVEPDTLKIIKKEQPEDGDYYDSSLKKLFTWKAYKRCNNFDTNKLIKAQEKSISDEWGIEYDNNYQLEIDDDGKYSITVIDNDGSNGKDFEYHIEEEGTLEPLK